MSFKYISGSGDLGIPTPDLNVEPETPPTENDFYIIGGTLSFMGGDISFGREPAIKKTATYIPQNRVSSDKTHLRCTLYP